MREFTTHHVVYQFDELNDQAKQKAIEQLRNMEYENGLDIWLPDAMHEKLLELLKQFHMKSGR